MPVFRNSHKQNYETLAKKGKSGKQKCETTRTYPGALTIELVSIRNGKNIFQHFLFKQQ